MEQSAVSRGTAAPRVQGPRPHSGDPLTPQTIPLTAQFPLTKGAPEEVTALWFLDDAPNPDHTLWGQVYLVAWKPYGGHNASLETALVNGLPGIGQHYYSVWDSPRAVGEVRVGSISGLNGTVHFTTSTGLTGNFDMATGTWRLPPYLLPH